MEFNTRSRELRVDIMNQVCNRLLDSVAIKSTASFQRAMPEYSSPLPGETYLSYYAQEAEKAPSMFRKKL